MENKLCYYPNRLISANSEKLSLCLAENCNHLHFFLTHVTLDILLNFSISSLNFYKQDVLSSTVKTFQNGLTLSALFIISSENKDFALITLGQTKGNIDGDCPLSGTHQLWKSWSGGERCAAFVQETARGYRVDSGRMSRGHRGEAFSNTHPCHVHGLLQTHTFHRLKDIYESVNKTSI